MGSFTKEGHRTPSSDKTVLWGISCDVHCSLMLLKWCCYYTLLLLCFTLWLTICLNTCVVQFYTCAPMQEMYVWIKKNCLITYSKRDGIVVYERDTIPLLWNSNMLLLILERQRALNGYWFCHMFSELQCALNTRVWKHQQRPGVLHLAPDVAIHIYLFSTFMRLHMFSQVITFNAWPRTKRSGPDALWLSTGSFRWKKVHPTETATESLFFLNHQTKSGMRRIKKQRALAV